MTITADLFAVIAKCSDGQVRQVALNADQHEQLKAAILQITGNRTCVTEPAIPLDLEDKRQRKAGQS